MAGRSIDASTSVFAGLCICTTGLAVHVKEQIRKIVLACDGTFEDDLTLNATTHLVADGVGSHKQRAAANKKLPVVSSKWIFDSFRAHTLLDVSTYALRVLDGIVVCTTGLSVQTRTQIEKLAALHGAQYEPNLEVGRTNVLIAQAPSGAKYEAAVAHGIPVVHVSWLHACIEKGALVDEASFSLENMLRPKRLYKQLRQELDDLSGYKKRQLIQRYWSQQSVDEPREEDDHETKEWIELYDACGFFLLGFPPEMERAVQSLIRMGMGTIYYEMQIPAVSHVIVSPVLHDESELERLEQLVVTKNATAIVHFVSAKWLVDSFKCLRLEPEEMYPVEIEEPFEDVAPPAIMPPPLDKRASIASSVAGAGQEDDEPMELELDGESAMEASSGDAKKPKLLKDYGFLLVCTDPEEPKLVRATVKQLQKEGGAQAVALDLRDFEDVEPAQFDFVTHIVVCSGVDLAANLAETQRMKFAAFYQSSSTGGKPRRVRFVSDLWVRCCLAADCVLSHQSHELFSMTYHQPRSMFPVVLPLPCFKAVVASTSVYVGVDRLVVMELLRMAGAQVSSKLSKKNTHLICLNPIGMKFEKAKEWGMTIVTARWVVQSVLQGELLDSTIPDFQVVEEDAVATDLSSSGSRTTLGSLEPAKSQSALTAPPSAEHWISKKSSEAF